MNNKGQTFAIFVIFLPLMIIFIFGIYDFGMMYYKKDNLDNINVMAIKYGLKNIDDENILEKIKKLINKNDNTINIKKIKVTDKIEIELNKEVSTTFSKVIGIKKIDISSHYIGDKKEIKKG